MPDKPGSFDPSAANSAAKPVCRPEGSGSRYGSDRPKGQEVPFFFPPENTGYMPVYVLRSMDRCKNAGAAGFYLQRAPQSYSRAYTVFPTGVLLSADRVSVPSPEEQILYAGSIIPDDLSDFSSFSPLSSSV